MRPLVLVEWLDSKRPVASWQFADELGDHQAVRCFSVGWLMADTDEVKALAPNLGDTDKADLLQVSGLITIPTCSVVRMARLSEDETNPKVRKARRNLRRKS